MSTENLSRKIWARVSEETGAKFDSLMVANGHKRPSAFLREVIEAVTKTEVKLRHAENDSGRGAEMRLVLTEQERIALDGARGTMPRTTYTLKVLRCHLMRRPEFDDQTRLALKESNRELLYLGKNINQVARQLNSSLSNSDKVHAQMLEELRLAIMQHTERVAKLLEASLNRWGGNKID